MFVPACVLGFERRSFIWTPISIIFENSKLKVGPSWLVYSVSILLLATSIDVHPLLSPPPDTMSTDSLQLSTLPGAHHLQLLSTGQSAPRRESFHKRSGSGANPRSLRHLATALAGPQSTGHICLGKKIMSISRGSSLYFASPVVCQL